jgi:hypothetical protein
MAFNIYQLDNLDYDDVEPLLDDYIQDVINEFVDSKAGQAHIEKFPQGGFWIGTFIEMAYLYGGYTLPKLTKGNVQEVMEYILPRKLTLMDPSDTDNAIAELTALWQYLGDTYKFRSAKAIAKYLTSIEDDFPQWMFDPSRGGLAKQFMMQGTEAGFDMTTQAGVEAFQEEYNRGLTDRPQLMPPLPEFAMTQAPPDMQQAFELLGLDLPKAGERVNTLALMQQFVGALADLDPDTANQLVSIMEAGAEAEVGAAQADNLRSNLLNMHVGEAPALTEADQERLRAQTITETTPGTIVQDFQTMLEFVQNHKVTLSGKLKQVSLKFLRDLNQRLTHPIDLDLKRPLQKSFPNLHGLYLLMRATSLGQIVAQGKHYQLVLNPEAYASWQQLSPTEQYFSLLEAWFIRSHPEMLGEERSGPLMMGDRCLQAWPRFTAKKSHTFATYDEQDIFFYYLPGIHNVALMELFGLVKLTSAKPEKGKGWRIKKLEVLPFGKSLMALLRDAYVAQNGQWLGINDDTQPLTELQPAVQPYFPEWQHSLMVPTFAFRPDRHIFKVALGKIWRRIAISGEATLAHLSSLILDSVGFGHDHLDQFTYQTPSGRTIEVVHPAYFDGPVFGNIELATDEVKIGSLPLMVGSTMEYLFDFGDCWQFQVQLEALEPAAELEASPGFAKVKGKRSRKSRSQKALGEVIEVHGEAPEQYPDYDEYE